MYREHPVWKRFERQKAAHEHRSLPARALIVIAGALLTVGGALTAPLPGPGPLVLVPLGLALLALEFTWAEVALGRSLKFALFAQRRASSAGRLQKGLAAVAMLSCATAVVAVVVLYDIPYLPG